MEDNTLGFWRQKDRYSCGVHSFGNAMAVLGVPISFGDAKEICGSLSYMDSIKKNLTIGNLLTEGVRDLLLNTFHAVGTETESIIDACKSLGFNTSNFYEMGDKKFINFLEVETAKGNPVILSTEEGDHWVVYLGKYKNSNVVMDSSEKDVICLYTKDELCERCIDSEYKYFGISIESKQTSIIRNLDEWLPLVIEDSFLRENWGDYLGALTNGLYAKPIRSKKNIFKEVKQIFSNLTVDNKDLINYTLDNFDIVARTYGLTVPEEYQNEVLVNFGYTMAAI